MAKTWRRTVNDPLPDRTHACFENGIGACESMLENVFDFLFYSALERNGGVQVCGSVKFGYVFLEECCKPGENCAVEMCVTI